MRQIQAKPLSREGFQKYGTYQNLLDDEAMGRASVNPAGFFPDLLALNFGTTTLPAVCCCSVQKQERNIVRSMEAHQYTCEGLLPLDADVIIFAGVLPPGGFTVDTLEAFIVPRGTFVKLEPLVVHGTQYCINSAAAHILCLLPQRTYRNDKLGHMIEKDEDRAEIIL